MNSPRRHRTKLLVAMAGAAVVATISMGTAASVELQPDPEATAPAEAQKEAPNGAYIVQLDEPPVVSYRGGVAGLKATKPAKGSKIDPLSSDVVAYVDYLTKKQDALLKAAGGGKKLYNYVYSYNGFSAKLSPSAVTKLSGTKGVVAVTPDEKRTLDTATTPDFLGLTDSQDGLWNLLGGASTAAKKTPGPGEDVIVGIVDSGIWPEHPSVSDRDSAGRRMYQQISGWNGRCLTGERFTAANCNQKLIGARFYNAGYGGNTSTKSQFPYEFISPRDFDGHGTHTATTAAGNYGVPATGPAAAFGNVSGMAPRARIAAYKVCWGNGTEGGCFSTDSVAAIDQAVADGVDVINFSISGSQTNFRDPVEIAFLFAADAGVFVAASAGNSGPTSSTVAHPSPWITTVAAGTHDRRAEADVTLGNGAVYTGASSATTSVSAPLIDAQAAGAPGADPTALRLCFSAADAGAAQLDPAKVAGKIVVCDRGVTARTSKSLAVQQAGGLGMILVNTSANSINADLHFVPTVHLDYPDRAAVKAYAAEEGATATIAEAVVDSEADAPFTASFSSRGPLRAGDGDLLKPDLIAPGQDILAGVAPPNYNGRLFDLLSGTSMSSPHVAGLAALLRDKYPTWSPMAIKSALMTTGYDVLDGGTPAPNTDPVLIFRQGAGHVKPNSAVNPGLVFDTGWNDWLGFLCGTQLPTSFCTSSGIPVLDPSDYNSPSIAIGNLAGEQTVKRTVTNVSGSRSTYDVSWQAAGFDVAVAPASFTLNPGQSRELSITLTRTTAALNAYAGGQLTWTDGTHDVRVPMVVRPVAMAAPAAVSGSGAPLSYPVTFGYTGPFTAAARGLVPATVTPGNVSDDPTDSSCSLSSPNAQKSTFTVPAGTTYARIATFDADVNAGSDIDLCVYRGTAQVGTSESGTSSEEVNLVNPVADTYTVVVNGWGVVGSTPFKLHTWLLGSSDAGNMTVAAPTSAVTGETENVNLSFSGLAAATKYLGSVAYSGIAGLPDPTIVRVDTP